MGCGGQGLLGALLLGSGHQSAWVIEASEAVPQKMQTKCSSAPSQAQWIATAARALLPAALRGLSWAAADGKNVRK